jgi:leader peptidase (prepilin peptidase)/N-methyltransferase
MMQRQWDNECCNLNNQEPKHTDKFNLATPASRCPHCGHKIRAWENIPVLSWLLLLKGKCSNCKAPISLRYPLVELATGILSLIIFMVFGPNFKMLTALVLTWSLIALTMIDFDTQLLPDDITLPLVWLGLLVNINGLWIPLEQAVIGAMCGYLSLWSIYWLFKLVTGKEGMGYGDFKLLAAFGAWIGPSQLPLIILLSSVVGAVIGGAYAIIRKQSAPFAFGPYLAIAGLIAVFGGSEIIDWYLGTWKH